MQGVQQQARTETLQPGFLPTGQAGSGTTLRTEREQGGQGCGTHLHAVSEHDAHGHELGEDLEQLGAGEHAVLQAAVQEARVVAQHMVDVGGLQGAHQAAVCPGPQPWLCTRLCCFHLKTDPVVLGGDSYTTNRK